MVRWRQDERLQRLPMALGNRMYCCRARSSERAGVDGSRGKASVKQHRCVGETRTELDASVKALARTKGPYVTPGTPTAVVSLPSNIQYASRGRNPTLQTILGWPRCPEKSTRDCSCCFHANGANDNGTVSQAPMPGPGEHHTAPLGALYEGDEVNT